MAAGEMNRNLSTWGLWSGLVLLMSLTACQSVDDKKDGDKSGSPEKADAGSPVDVSFLLTMTFDEARKMSGASEMMPPFYKIAADEVKVLARAADNNPKRLSAKGRVFLQIDFREKLSALAQEALVSPEEVILRGKPLLKRGRTVVEGMDDTTVFYIRGVDLKVIGKHRITTDSGVTRNWSRSWKEGPNPLLPALSPNDVPKEIRASPLLPPPPGMASPSSDAPPKSGHRAVGESLKDADEDAPRAIGERPKMREPDDLNGKPKS